MRMHCEYRLHSDHKSIILDGDCEIEFEYSDNEIIRLGTPKCWDDALLSRLDFEELSIYHICGTLMEHGRYNAVTDHRKIWGLNHLEKGLYDNSYMVKNGKVYFGITQGKGKDCFLSDTSSTMLLVPDRCELDPNEVFLLFKDKEVEFRKSDVVESLKTLIDIVPDLIALHYSAFNGAKLYILNQSIEGLLKESDLMSWPKNNVEIVIRKGL